MPLTDKVDLYQAFLNSVRVSREAGIEGKVEFSERSKQALLDRGINPKGKFSDREEFNGTTAPVQITIQDKGNGYGFLKVLLKKESGAVEEVLEVNGEATWGDVRAFMTGCVKKLPLEKVRAAVAIESGKIEQVLNKLKG